MTQDNRPIPPEGANNVQETPVDEKKTNYNSMPLPPSSPKAKNKLLPRLALVGLGLCLSGLILGAAPMFIAGGPLEIAKDSGYASPERHVDTYDAHAFNVIKVLNTNLEALGESPSNLNQKIYLENSSSGKIEYEYTSNMNTLAKVEQYRDELTLGTKTKSENKAFGIPYNNLYMLFADLTDSNNYDYSMVVRVPKDWAGTIEIPGSYLYAKDFECAGSIVSQNKTQMIRSHFENLKLGGNLKINAQNISLEHAKIDGDIEVRELSDDFSVWLQDVEASSIYMHGAGNFGFNKISANDINLDSSGYIYGLLSGSSSDYSLDLNGAFYADYFINQDRAYENGDERYSYTDRLGISRLSFNQLILDDILSNDAGYAIIDRQSMSKSYFYAVPWRDFYPDTSKVLHDSDLSIDALQPENYKHAEYKLIQEKEGAPKLSLKSSNEMIQLGFEGDELVLGYKNRYLGAEAMRMTLEQNQNDRFRNEVRMTNPLNIALINTYADALGVEKIPSLEETQEHTSKSE